MPLLRLLLGLALQFIALLKQDLAEHSERVGRSVNMESVTHTKAEVQEVHLLISNNSLHAVE